MKKLLALIGCFTLAGLAHADTFTNRLSLDLPSLGASNWGTTLNNNMTTIDANITVPGGGLVVGQCMQYVGNQTWQTSGAACNIASGAAAPLGIQVGGVVVSSPTGVVNFSTYNPTNVGSPGGFVGTFQSGATTFVQLSSTQTFATVTVTSNTVLPGATFYQNGSVALGTAGMPVLLASSTLNGVLNASNGIGTSNQVLRSQGPGSAPQWSSDLSIGGSTGQLQYNNAGALAGVAGSTVTSSSVTYNGTLQVATFTVSNPVVSVYQGQNTGTINGSFNVTAYPNKLLDVDSNYNGSTFTAPTAGYYYINAGTEISGTSSAGSAIQLGVFLNGVEQCEIISRQDATLTSNFPAVVTCILKLAVNDKISIQVTTGLTGSPGYINAPANQILSIFKIY